MCIRGYLVILVELVCCFFVFGVFLDLVWEGRMGVVVVCRFIWYLMSMLKKLFFGFWGFSLLRRCFRLLCVIRSSGRLFTLVRWLFSRRFCELAMRSKNFSVWGEVVSEGWVAVGLLRVRFEVGRGRVGSVRVLIVVSVV